MPVLRVLRDALCPTASGRFTAITATTKGSAGIMAAASRRVSSHSVCGAGGSGSLSLPTARPADRLTPRHLREPRDRRPRRRGRRGDSAGRKILLQQLVPEEHLVSRPVVFEYLQGRRNSVLLPSRNVHFRELSTMGYAHDWGGICWIGRLQTPMLGLNSLSSNTARSRRNRPHRLPFLDVD